LGPALDERTRRLLAGAEALTLGHGGVAQVARITGLDRRTVQRGMEEVGRGDVEAPVVDGKVRVRAPGGGRKTAEEKDPTLMSDLDSLVEPTTRGDPMSPLRWTCKSLRQLARALKKMGHQVSVEKVRGLLVAQGYSLQANRKTVEGNQHPDRDAQFRYLNRQCKRAMRAGAPVISVDTKKKELVGNYQNGGREWRPEGAPEEVKVHDFIDKELGKAIPYGVYDVGRNEGWVNVGIDHDTGAFAVASIRRWWFRIGQYAYPGATELVITADAGGSNAPRNNLWRSELQRFADDTGLKVMVCHFPPGTSKWNKIEHRMFSHISVNWRGKPLRDIDTIVQLIGNTTTTQGLHIKAAVDDRHYPNGIKVPKHVMESLNIKRHKFHGDWNYTLCPRL